MIEIEDLTKEELISLIKRQPLRFSRRDIARIRWDSLNDRATALREQSIAVSQSITGDTNPISTAKKWSIADSFWKQAEKLQAEADEVLKEMNGDG